MTASTAIIESYVLPVDLELTRNRPLLGGAIHLVAESDEKAAQIREQYEEIFPFAACGATLDEASIYLRPNEWVMAVSKQSLIDTVFRLRSYGTYPIWRDWSEVNPEGYEKFFADRELIRDELVERRLWSDDLQSKFGLTTRNDRLGWWMFADLPVDSGLTEWTPKSQVVSNPELTEEKAAFHLKAILFDEIISSKDAALKLFDKSK